MAEASFSFNPYPYRYIAQYIPDNGGVWKEELQELPNRGRAESTLSEQELHILLQARCAAGDLPLVNYTTQYGFGCFEGTKAYPQPDGSFALFRVDMNAKRFYRSMEGLRMPPFPEEQFIAALKDVAIQSRRLGFYPTYQASWEDNNFQTAKAIYFRPFSYSESAIGVNISKTPYIIVVATEVGNYFDVTACPSLLVSDRIRATPKGTGWIKCAANYVISVLAKQEAMDAGYTESLFLDAQHRQYVEECSSCNIFFVLKNNVIVTPPLSDTILPGITRDTAIIIARDLGHTVEERAISIEEVFDSAKECFVTGTAVGAAHFGRITHHDRHIVFGDGTIGEIAYEIQTIIKKIQYGLQPDTHKWKIVI